MAGGVEVAKVFASLALETAGFEKGVQRAVKDTKNLADETDKAAEKTAKHQAMLKKTSTALIGAGTAMLAFMGKAAFAASDLDEAINVTGLVFEDSAAQIGKWAETAAQSMGQSERAAREGAAQIGGLIKNMGFGAEETAEWSMKLVQLKSTLHSVPSGHGTTSPPLLSGTRSKLVCGTAQDCPAGHSNSVPPDAGSQ